MRARHEDIFREFQRGRLHLIAYIRSLVGDSDRAEDLFQEVSVAFLQKLETKDPIRDVAAWSRGTARHLVYRERTRAKRVQPFATDRIADLVDLAFQEHQDRHDTTEERHSFLARCMQTLAPTARQLLDLRYVSGMSLRELGEHLNRTEGAVQVALSRIRRALLECIRRHESRPA